MARVGIIGATGYTGGELIRILLEHPDVDVTVAASRRDKIIPVDEIFPQLGKICDLEIVPIDVPEICKYCDVVFLALPHKTSFEIVPELLNNDLVVIDLSADYRLDSAKTYQEWYEVEHDNPALLKKAVYGMPEIYGNDILDANLIAVPGCYPTSIILGLAPLVKENVLEIDGLIADSASGVSGAGRNLTEPFIFNTLNQSFKAYKVTGHRHIPEIEQELSKMAAGDVRISFTPHLLPVNRGILSTIYGRLSKKISIKSVHALYHEFYGEEPFVRLLPLGEAPDIKHVVGSNFCDISLFHDKRTGLIKIVTAIDNLIKGAAGNAIHCMNIRYGYKEISGLTMTGLYP
jgi:N-acetyl-gamma-glutamyl-phosphate reductase